MLSYPVYLPPTQSVLTRNSAFQRSFPSCRVHFPAKSTIYLTFQQTNSVFLRVLRFVCESINYCKSSSDTASQILDSVTR